MFRSAAGFHVPMSKVCPVILRNYLLCRLSLRTVAFHAQEGNSLLPSLRKRTDCPILPAVGLSAHPPFPLPAAGRRYGRGSAVQPRAGAAAWGWVRDGRLAGGGSQGRQPRGCQLGWSRRGEGCWSQECQGAPAHPWGHQRRPGCPVAWREMGGPPRPVKGLCSSDRRVIRLWQPGAVGDMMTCFQFQGTSSRKRFCMLIPPAPISQACGCRAAKSPAAVTSGALIREDKSHLPQPPLAVVDSPQSPP